MQQQQETCSYHCEPYVSSGLTETHHAIAKITISDSGYCQYDLIMIPYNKIIFTNGGNVFDDNARIAVDNLHYDVTLHGLNKQNQQSDENRVKVIAGLKRYLIDSSEKEGQLAYDYLCERFNIGQSFNTKQNQEGLL